MSEIHWPLELNEREAEMTGDWEDDLHARLPGEQPVEDEGIVF